jgi:hypothetical protein
MEIFTGKNFLIAAMIYCFIMGFLLVSSLDIFRMYLEWNYHINSNTINGKSSTCLKQRNNYSSILFCIPACWRDCFSYITFFMIEKSRVLFELVNLMKTIHKFEKNEKLAIYINKSQLLILSLTVNYFFLSLFLKHFHFFL